MCVFICVTFQNFSTTGTLQQCQLYSFMRHRHPWLRAKNLFNKHGGAGAVAAVLHSSSRDRTVTTATSQPLYMRWHTVTKKKTQTNNLLCAHIHSLKHTTVENTQWDEKWRLENTSGIKSGNTPDTRTQRHPHFLWYTFKVHNVSEPRVSLCRVNSRAVIQ